MKIIKQGKIPDDKKRFTCRLCGCVFVAEKGEYVKVPMQYNEIGCECDCPCCGSKCYQYQGGNV